MIDLVEKLSYIAGIFDIRGFVRYDYGKNYQYAVSFNFTESEKAIWEEIGKDLKEFCHFKIYKAKRKKGKQREYQLYISGKKNVYNFLMKILPYSKRKKEIHLYLWLLRTKGRKLNQ